MRLRGDLPCLLRRLGLVVVFPAVTLLRLAGCAHTEAPLHPVGPEGSFYVVGIESLADIAKRQGVPLEDLAEINGLLPGARLEPGQVIFVLAPPPAPAAMRDGVHDPKRLPADLSDPLDAPLPPSFDDPPPGSPGKGGLAWPLDAGQMSSVYGRRWGRKHEGIDLAAPVGTPLLAAKDGLVLYAADTVKGYGNMVVLQHDGDLLTAYAHTSVLLVHKGDRVRTGQIIARVGQTGHATAPHLHFEVRQGQIPRDPLRYLPPRR